MERRVFSGGQPRPILRRWDPVYPFFSELGPSIYARTLPRATKFGKVTHHGEGHKPCPPSQGSLSSRNFWDPTPAHVVRHILQDDQSRWDATLSRVHHAPDLIGRASGEGQNFWPITYAYTSWARRMLTRDLFVVANFLLFNWPTHFSRDHCQLGLVT